MMEQPDMENIQLLGAVDNERRIEDFYRSCDPETSLNHPLRNYSSSLIHNNSKSGGCGIFLGADAAPGQMLLVENTKVFCACVRDCVTNEYSSTHAPTPVPTPSSCRIPRNAHEHLACKLADLIQMQDGTAFWDIENQWIPYLDASRLSSGVLPNLDERVDPRLGLENGRGPWVETSAGGRNLVSDRVWNIVANNAICEKVSVRIEEAPSKVETCELWGLWQHTSFINHSCSPNCHAKVVGNAIIIRAAVAMASGEELTLPYFDIFQPLHTRELATEKWGFRCTCPRCAFERSLGKAYDDMQAAILNLKQQIQSSWTLMSNIETRNRVGQRLLEKLAVLVFPIEALVQKWRLEALRRMNKPLSSEEVPNEREMKWIRASLLIEPYIALYALCEAGSVSDSLKQHLAKSFIPSGTRTLDAINVCYRINTILHIIGILDPVHPGSLLCQEFYSILWNASDDFIDCDLEENLALNRGFREWITKQGIELCQSYYGKDPHEYIEDVMMAPGY